MCNQFAITMSAVQILYIALVLYASVASGMVVQRSAQGCNRPVSCPDDAQMRVLQSRCSNRLILEITGYCRMLCPKQLGDTCGGRCGEEGICIDDGSTFDEGIKCNVSIGVLAANSNLTNVGRCVRKCRANYTLADNGICVPQCQHDYMLNSNGNCTHKICSKDCLADEILNVCGSDGRWYRNLCVLQQQSLCHKRNVVQSNESTCNSACSEVPSPDNGNVTLSNELVLGSVATLNCIEGYMLDRQVKPVCGNNGWNQNLPSCISPPCATQNCGDTRRYKCIHDNDTTTGYIIARCVCKTHIDCDNTISRVCGSGKIYQNLCHFYVGTCNLTVNPYKCKRMATAPKAPSKLLLQSRAKH